MGALIYFNRKYYNKWDGADDYENPLPDETYFYVLIREIFKPVRAIVRHLADGKYMMIGLY